MAMINCPECGKEISDKATTCPNCGNPLKRKQLETPVIEPSDVVTKLNKCLLISFIIGLLYSVYSIVYWSGASATYSGAEAIGAGIATMLVLPHVCFTILATIFNGLGVFMQRKWFALTGAILYCVALLLFPLYFYFVVIELILSFVGFAQMRKFEKLHPNVQYKGNILIPLITIGVVFIAGAICGIAFRGENVSTQNTPADTSSNINSSLEPTQQPAASSGENDTQEISSESIESNIVVEGRPTLDGAMCVFITNNSTEIIDELMVQVNYKSEDGKTISTANDGHDMILPGFTVVSRLDAPDSYADFEVVKSIELGVHPNYENHSNDVVVNSNLGDDCVIIEITNNSDVKLDEAEYAVVFYSGDDVASISYAEDVYDINSGDTITKECSSRGITYDRYDVYLNQAHTFNLN